MFKLKVSRVLGANAIFLSEKEKCLKIRENLMDNYLRGNYD